MSFLDHVRRTGRPAPSEGHPHRCQEGHHWQHRGPSALTCELRAPDRNSESLWDVAPEDCPLCPAREAAMREPHSHRCPECRGEWTHEGRCADGRLAWCPSCSPESDSSSAGPRGRGPHVHCCSACRQTWRHATSCDAPLRATLPDCPGCRKRGSETPARSSKATVASRHRRRRARRGVVPLVAVPVLVLALAMLLVPWRLVRIPLEGRLAVRAPISMVNERAPGRVESALKESAYVGGWARVRPHER